MNYKTYKNVRNASWKCLINYKIDRLPTNLGKICRQLNVIIVGNSDLDQNALSDIHRGKVMVVKNTTYIVVNDNDPMPVQRYTVAHEIGHIILGKQASEQEAERFAIGILAPACVLWALNAITPNDIEKFCGISHRSAQIRSERMQVLIQRNKFLTHPLERKVLEQFRPFIIKNRKVI